MSDAELLTLLRDCYTPQGRNIVDAGLVRAVRAQPDTDAPGAGIPGVPQRCVVEITLYAPSNDEAATAQLAAQVENRLLGVAAIARVSCNVLPALFSIL